MPIIDTAAQLRTAFRGATQIHREAEGLLSYSGSIPFDRLREHLDTMREIFQDSMQPIWDRGAGEAANVNADVAALFQGAPAATYEQIGSLRSALIALYQAYNSVFSTLTPITHTVANGHQYAAISLSQLSSLSDEVTAVRDAAAPLRL